MRVNLRFCLITLAAVVGVGVTLSLGQWQLSRAAQKENLQLAIEAQNKRLPLSTAELLGQADPTLEVHRTVSLRGTWVPGRTVFLDNRQMNAKPGFYVVTPLLLDNSTKAVLVQRGWVARNFTDRAKVPAIESPAGQVHVKGRIAPPPSKLYELGAADLGVIRQNIDLAAFKAETGLPLLPISVVQLDDQDSGEPGGPDAKLSATSGANAPRGDGLLREWPVVGLTASKNYGYAFQWFGLGALITLLYGWFQIGKRFNDKRDQAN